MKHTPGAWHLGKGNGGGSIFTDQETRMRMTDKGTTLYPICKIIDGWNKEEDGANAFLIASAPDLLEACKEMVKLYDAKELIPPDKFPVMWGKVRNAISKAEGGK